MKLDLEAWAEKFKVLASNRTDRDQLGARRVRPLGLSQRWHGVGMGMGQGGSSARWGRGWGALLGHSARGPAGLVPPAQPCPSPCSGQPWGHHPACPLLAGRTAQGVEDSPANLSLCPGFG